MLIPFGTLAASGAGAALPAMELISTTVLPSSAADVTFDVSSLASTYKHLQIRMVARCTFSDPERSIYLQLNGDGSNNYSNHGLFAQPPGNPGSYGTTSFLFFIGSFAAANAASGAYGAAVIDILDAFSATKNKTMKSLAGSATTPQVSLRSAAWLNTNSITSIKIYDNTSNLVAGSRFSIYGIKG
jgi:hypothetical protein